MLATCWRRLVVKGSGAFVTCLDGVCETRLKINCAFSWMDVFKKSSTAFIFWVSNDAARENGILNFVKKPVTEYEWEEEFELFFIFSLFFVSYFFIIVINNYIISFGNHHFIPSHSKKGGAKANPKNTRMKIVGSDMLSTLLKHIHICSFFNFY